MGAFCTELEYQLLEGCAESVTKLSMGAKARTGCITEINPDTKEEKRIQFVEIDGHVRINLTAIADRLRVAIQNDRAIEFRFHPNPASGSKPIITRLKGGI